MSNGRGKDTPNIHKAEQPNDDMTAEDLLKGYAFAKHRNEHGVAVDSWYRVLQAKLDTAKHLEEMIAASIRLDSARTFPWKKQVRTFFGNVEVVDALQQFARIVKSSRKSGRRSSHIPRRKSQQQIRKPIRKNMLHVFRKT